MYSVRTPFTVLLVLMPSSLYVKDIVFEPFTASVSCQPAPNWCRLFVRKSPDIVISNAKNIKRTRLVRGFLIILNYCLSFFLYSTFIVIKIFSVDYLFFCLDF